MLDCWISFPLWAGPCGWHFENLTRYSYSCDYLVDDAYSYLVGGFVYFELKTNCTCLGLIKTYWHYAFLVSDALGGLVVWRDAFDWCNYPKSFRWHLGFQFGIVVFSASSGLRQWENLAFWISDWPELGAWLAALSFLASSWLAIAISLSSSNHFSRSVCKHLAFLVSSSFLFQVLLPEPVRLVFSCRATSASVEDSYQDFPLFS